MTASPPPPVPERAAQASPPPDAVIAEARAFATRRRIAVQGKTLEIATQALLLTLLPRLLGPVEFGRLMLALAIVTIGTALISLGAPSAFVRFLPAERDQRRLGLARAMTLRLLPRRGVQLAGAAVIGVGLVVAAPQRFAALDTALVLGALALEVGALLAAQVALGIGRTWVWSLRLAIRNAALLVAVPVLFVLTGSAGVLAGVVLASAIGLVFAAVTIVGLVRRAPGGVPVPRGVDRYGIVTGIGGLAGQFTYRGPVLAAGVLAGSAVETGFAGLAGGIAMAIMFAVREVFTVSLPELVQQWERDRAGAQRVLRRLGWRATWVLIAGALAGALTLERVLPLVAGSSFAPAAAALVPVLALMPLLPLPAVAVQAAALELRPGLSVAINVVGLAAFVVAAVVLVPLWGARGAGLALLAAVTASSVLAVGTVPAAVRPSLLAVGLASALGVLVIG